MIAKYIQKIKGFVAERQDKIVLIVGVILIALISFGLGMLYNREISKEPIVIEEPAENANHESRIMNYDSGGNSSLNFTASATNTSMQTQTEVVVASRNGTKYHLPSCPGAKQIKSENKITFSSPQEAEAAGYEPASNCPGLKAP